MIILLRRVIAVFLLGAIVLATAAATAQPAPDSTSSKPDAGAQETALREAEEIKSEDPARALARAIEVERALPAGAAPALRARVVHLQGWAQWKLGELEQAMALARETERLAAGAGHPGMQAEGIQLVGLVQLDNGEFEPALEAFRRGLALARSMDKPSAIGQAYNNIGIVLRRLGRMDEALEAYREALAYRRQGDDSSAVAQTLNNLGVTLAYLGDYPQALAAHSESLDIKRRSGKDEEISDSLYNIAQVYEHLGDFEQALTDYSESFRYDERAGQKRNMALGLNKISTIELKLDRLDAADGHARQALDLFEELGSGRSAASALITLGRIALARQRPAEAIGYLDRAHAIGEESKERAVAANASLYLAEAHQAQGHTGEAIVLARAAHDIFEDIGLKNELRDTLALLSRLHEAAGDPVAALAAQRAHGAVERALLDEQRLRQLGGTRRAIEIQQREREIERLQRQSEQQARDVERATWARNFWLAVGAGVFLLVFLLASRYWHRRQLAEQMRVNRSLQRLDALKDEFLANTSHELRTPLMGILGLAESILDGGSGAITDKARHELGLIVASGSRLSTLVDDILDLSKIRRDQLQLDIRPVDLHVVADIVLALAAPLIAGRELELCNGVPEDLPAAEADENRLQQILHNLVGNAIKFTEHGSVTVRARAEGERIVVEVADTGVGIPLDRQQSIFEPFEQGDGTITRTHGGTGLGLAVTRKLVELHGGRIGVESAPGEGAVFRFDLPRSAGKADAGSSLQRRTRSLRALAGDAPARSDVDAPAVAARRRGDQFRVLVVDDEPVNRNVLVNFLSEQYHVREAADGAQALAMLQEEPADLLLLDIMMPGVSGYDVCRALRARMPVQELPVIMLTASHRLHDLLQGFALGANDYLTKPISKAELLSRVEMHLRLLDISRNLERKVAERTAELEQTTALLRRASETDFLTGLPNRRGLQAQLPAIGYGERRAVLLLDIDNFKQINDRYGHECGDEVLRGVAEVLRSCQRAEDLVARWGGEEFMVVLPDTATEDAMQIASRICVEIAARTFDTEQGPLRVTATVGVAIAEPGADFESEVRRADQALYEGKAAGKNRARLASADIVGAG